MLWCLASAPAQSRYFYFIAVRDGVDVGPTIILCLAWDCVMELSHLHHVSEWRARGPASIVVNLLKMLAAT